MSNTVADYNLYLVALSYGVSVLGSLAGLLVASSSVSGTARCTWAGSFWRRS